MDKEKTTRDDFLSQYGHQFVFRKYKPMDKYAFPKWVAHLEQRKERYLTFSLKWIYKGREKYF